MISRKTTDIRCVSSSDNNNANGVEMRIEVLPPKHAFAGTRDFHLDEAERREIEEELRRRIERSTYRPPVEYLNEVHVDGIPHFTVSCFRIYNKKTRSVAPAFYQEDGKGRTRGIDFARKKAELFIGLVDPNQKLDQVTCRRETLVNDSTSVPFSELSHAVQDSEEARSSSSHVVTAQVQSANVAKGSSLKGFCSPVLEISPRKNRGVGSTFSKVGSKSTACGSVYPTSTSTAVNNTSSDKNKNVRNIDPSTLVSPPKDVAGPPKDTATPIVGKVSSPNEEKSISAEDDLWMKSTGAEAPQRCAKSADDVTTSSNRDDVTTPAKIPRFQDSAQEELPADDPDRTDLHCFRLIA